jgi:hypothetical protein
MFLDVLYNNFLKRGYPSTLLHKIRDKIALIPRHNILKPKTKLIITSLQQNFPCILNQYQNVHENVHENVPKSENVYIVMPYYKNMYNFSNMLIEFIEKEKCKPEYSHILSTVKLIVSYKKINTLENVCNVK